MKVGLVLFTADKPHGYNPVEGRVFP